MKVFIFSDIGWSIGRVHSGIKKYAPNSEFRLTGWSEYSYSEFVENYKWCDVCITNLICQQLFINEWTFLGLEKTVFLSHGLYENETTIPNPAFKHAVCSDSLLKFYKDIPVKLLPNGVDHELFDYSEHSGSVDRFGWCGAPRVDWKQVDWAEAISKYFNKPLDIAGKKPYTTHENWQPLSYDELKAWYKTIDILLVTAVPIPERETGPLPPFEAIMSGVIVIGTPVGNFRHVPGPKFNTVQDAIEIMKILMSNPELVKGIQREQYDYVMNNFTYKNLAPRWIESLRFSKKRVLVYSKLDWSVARVFKDVEKVLSDEFDFKYYDWGNTTETLIEEVNNADIVLTTLPAYGYLKNINLSKSIFVCHGYPEFNDVPNISSDLRFAMTSEAIRPLFPTGSNVMLTPNGVDPSHFNHRIHSGRIAYVGWVGREDPSSGGHKRSNWVKEIANQSDLEYRFATDLPFEVMKHWYSFVDILLITAGPELWRETGPLPVYEAIVSGVPVIGTRVGNFANIPGPKFDTIEEGIEILKDLKYNRDKVKKICSDQYEYVMKNYTYTVLAEKWRKCLRSSFHN